MSVLIFTSLYPVEHDKPKLALFPLPYSGVEAKEADAIYHQIQENFSKSGWFEILPPDEEAAAIKELNISPKDIKREAALTIGRQLDLHFVGLYQLTKDEQYILDVEIIGIGYFAGQSVQFVKHIDDIKTVGYYANEAVNFVIERIFLVDVYFEKNRRFLVGELTRKQINQKKIPVFTTDNFFVSRKSFVSLNIAYNIPVADYSFLDPFLYLDLFFDYSLFSTDLFVISPYIEVNYFQHKSYVSATTQNILGCIGFSGGVCFSVTFPFYRPVSLHLSAGCGLEASSINWERPISTDFMAAGTFEARYTFIEQISASLFLSYMFINYTNSVFHEIRIGTSVGYRF
jgi:hypothetical protein